MGINSGGFDIFVIFDILVALIFLIEGADKKKCPKQCATQVLTSKIINAFSAEFLSVFFFFFGGASSKIPWGSTHLFLWGCYSTPSSTFSTPTPRGLGAAAPPPPKFGSTFLVSYYVSECLKIRLR